MLEQFLDEKCRFVPGSTIKFGDFFERFVKWLDVGDAISWPKNKVSRALPSKHPKGRSHFGLGSTFHIGNIAWEEEPTQEPKQRLVLRGDFLCPME
jgi:hypothetical protein